MLKKLLVELSLPMFWIYSHISVAHFRLQLENHESLVVRCNLCLFQALCVPDSRTRGQVVGIPISRADVIISVSI
jgi:hypothetical protein